MKPSGHAPPMDVRAQLQALQLFSLQPGEQVAIAAKLQDAGFSSADLAALYRYARGTTDLTSRQVKGQLARMFREETLQRLREVCEAARAWQEDRASDIEDEDMRMRDRQRAGSHPRCCMAENPYGWKAPEMLRGQDHDQPGQWNAFRQSQNLTAAQRAKYRARDHRRRGCSRFEVIGHRNDPRVEWDQAEADRIRNFSLLSEPLNAGQSPDVDETAGRDIYQ